MSHDMQTVQEVSKQTLETSKQTPPQSRQRKANRLPRTHADYWKARLFRNTYTRDGVLCEVNELSVKVQHLGKRQTFALGTTNKEVAAAKARDIYLALAGKGWDAATALYNPDMVARKDDPTVGEFLADVMAKANLKPKTFRNYAACLRRIVAGVFGFDPGASKYDYCGEGNKQWRERVDSVRLGNLTPDKVQAWKVAHLKAARSNPAAHQSAKRTVSSYIRCARSLFSPKITKFLKVRLPKPLPFDGVESERAGCMKYNSTIRPELLVASARCELRADHADSYKAFVLGLFCGLRRSEIDSLEWSAFDWHHGTVTIANTAVLSVKTDGSEGVVEVDAEVLDELRQFMAGSLSSFVLESHLPARPGLDRQYYRCDHHFQHLTDWLRSKGIEGNKPLHTLRKEFGSLINQRHGLFAASQALRHADISTSARHYVAKKERISAGLGKLLTQPSTTEAATKLAA